MRDAKATMEQTHAAMVSNLIKPGEVIKDQLTPKQAHILHMVVGISGEAGELLDAIKKNVVYQKDLDMDNVIEELGDLEFYMEGLRQAVGVNRETCLRANYNKLHTRYAAGKYSDQAAQERADKKDE